MIVPRLGGTPQVWNTCMMFFQMVLLAGYAYTHTVTTKLAVKKTADRPLPYPVVATAFSAGLGRPFPVTELDFGAEGGAIRSSPRWVY